MKYFSESPSYNNKVALKDLFDFIMATTRLLSEFFKNCCIYRIKKEKKSQYDYEKKMRNIFNKYIRD